MARLTLDGISRHFGDVRALDEVGLTIESGEFVAILGPSGCGKTTLLRLVAGFERPTAGALLLDEDVQASPTQFRPPEARGIGMVFQSYALWPHMDVAGNVGYPLRVRRVTTGERDTRVAEALDEVGLAGYGTRRPSELSGGQRQRVALARCLVMQPRVVLFDEPLANLDMHLRESMLQAFRAFHERSGATVLYVTHDQAEAMALADRIVVLDHGRTQQVGAPRELYARPATEMVARFVGRAALCPVTVSQARAESCTVSLGDHTLDLDWAGPTDGPVLACVRPEQVELVSDSGNGLPGVVIESVFRGHCTSLRVRLDDTEQAVLQVDVVGQAPASGDGVQVRITDGWCIPRTVS